ncbi:MAG: Na(+)-translocating NADH-quinone reductase subunit B [Candidatus Ozemobacter sibiricus]|uniref:Na(+)-translocating NADH-quinone reductase subunit B n=1 Tax=Candidatus Ozemobacter sibiricus TaxID=2268124 RepID=A0A367ZTT5_9BACT|nr:MAG: Na(+)-translocating NADH-quinone reductase subunit B [Candidatus Ozemobacter sibiricus]
MLGLSLLTGFLVDTLAFRLRSDRAPRWSWVIWVVFPLALSAGVPLWLVPIGLSFGLVFGLHLFGGYGRTLFPTAAVGIVFLALGYSTAFNITTKPFADPDLGFSRWASQIPLAGTVFADLRKFGDIPITDFLTGRIPGAIGESYGGYLILLGVVLLIAGFIDWRFVSAVIGGMVTFAWLGAHWFPGQVLPPHNQLLAGSFLLYLTVFVPSDPFALPRTPEGRWAGGLLFAFFTVMLRSFSGFAEGVWFAALLLAVFSPLIDQLVGEHLYRRPRGSA